MAWNFFAGTVAPGESVRWAFWWGDGRHEYKGIQVVQAKPVREGGIIVIDGAPDLRVSDSPAAVAAAMAPPTTVANWPGNAVLIGRRICPMNGAHKIKVAATRAAMRTLDERRCDGAVFIQPGGDVSSGVDSR